MRKQILKNSQKGTPEPTHHWLNPEDLARIELTSEDPAHPIEAAMHPGGSGWQAAESGEQTLTMLFDDAQQLRVIRLVFEEPQQQRTQEFVLRWSADDGKSWHDIARQQYSFSSPDSTCEIEEYSVDLHSVTGLKLSITPNISGGALASLAEWRIA